MSDNGVCVVVAMYGYEAKLEDELSLMVGDIVRCVFKREGNWWYGKIGDRGGYFPEHYVHSVDFLDYHIKSRCKEYMVVYFYHPVRVDELELIPGQLVEVVGEDEPGWWKGRNGNRLGVFPSNYVSGPLNPNEEVSLLLTRLMNHRTDQTKPLPRLRLFNNRPDVLIAPVVFSRHVPISANLFDPEDEPPLLLGSLDLVDQFYLKSISNTESRMNQSKNERKKSNDRIRFSVNNKSHLKRFLSCGTLFDDDSCSPIRPKRRNTVSELMKNNLHSIKKNQKRRMQEPKFKNGPSFTLRYNPVSWMKAFTSTPIVEDHRRSRNSSSYIDSRSSAMDLTLGSFDEESTRSKFSLDFSDSYGSERPLIGICSKDSGVGGCIEDNYDHSDETFGLDDISDKVFNDVVKSSEPLLSAVRENTKLSSSKIRTSLFKSITSQLGQKRNLISTNPSVFWSCTKKF